MRKRTKILATLGPASGSEKMLGRLLAAGMDLVRLNMSHGNHETHLSYQRHLRAAARRRGVEAGVLVDLQGPKIRIGDLPPEGLALNAGDEVTLTSRRSALGKGTTIPVPGLKWIASLERGEHILINDGAVELVVTVQTKHGPRARVRVGGHLTSRKGLNFPGRAIPVSALTPKDRRDLEFAIQCDTDFVALSFVQSAADIKSLRRAMKKLIAGRSPQVVAKIEKPQALTDIDNIIDACDGIMVARGDLGVELSVEKVPAAQKRILDRCAAAEKWAVVATQMLESMIANPTPTRAEVSDVANAIYDGADCLMLSAETSVGRHPVRAVETMATVAREAEQTITSYGHLQDTAHADRRDIAHATARAALVLAAEAEADAIVVFTQSGRTAQLIAKMRPDRRIIAFSPQSHTLRMLAGMWGVEPHGLPLAQTAHQMIDTAREKLLADRICRRTARVVFLAGEAMTKGATNMIKVAALT